MAVASGEQNGLSERPERANESPPSYRLRPLLLMIYLVRRSMKRGSMTRNTWPRSRPAAARCTTTERKFALLNRRLRSFFDRTGGSRASGESNLASIASFVRIADAPVHSSSMFPPASRFFSLSQTALLFITVIVDFWRIPADPGSELVSRSARK